MSNTLDTSCFRDLSEHTEVGILGAKQSQSMLEFFHAYENNKTNALIIQLAPYKAIFAFDSADGFSAAFLTEDYSYNCACLGRFGTGRFGPLDVLRVLEELDGEY